jgi:hypothetical protein|tara:strand:- start:514 stop:765 length:252 start_codon:yes stop_codon:yes gene_type:complete
MKAKKLGRVEQLEKKMHSCTQLIEQLLRQNTYLRDLAVGTLETIKLMPDYEEAIQKLKEQTTKQAGEDAGGEKKFEPLGEAGN